ncbi:MAG: metallophosphoesterase family protein [Chloroflexi bacterium]|nr:metallophosphoesterase family protein [Chloroflexota bacterium]
MITHNGHLRIGLVTDTHIPDVAKALPPELATAFKGVDLIMHAGDIYSLTVLDDLARIAPVFAARGDDDAASTLSDERVKDKHVFQIGGKTVWLVHERPYLYETRIAGPGPGATGTENKKPDVVVFGHEHSVTVREHSGVLWVNSGSPTFLRYNYGLGTVGILEIDSGVAKAEIRQL